MWFIRDQFQKKFSRAGMQVEKNNIFVLYSCDILVLDSSGLFLANKNFIGAISFRVVEETIIRSFGHIVDGV